MRQGTKDEAAVPHYPFGQPAPLEAPVEWGRMRQECPVARVTLPSGDEATLLTRYDDVRTALRDPRLSREGAANEDAARVAEGDGDIFNSPMARTLNAVGHERWRRLLGRWFTAKRIRALRPDMERVTERLIDEMTAQPGPADLVAGLAFPFPVYVICAMLGVPERDRDSFKNWSDTFLSVTKYSADDMATAQREFADYMTALIAEKRADLDAGRVAEGEEDLLTLLLTTPDGEGDVLPDEALVATGQALLLAGHETTAGFIAVMVAHLLSDRDRWERLLADRTLIRPAVEEALRIDPSNGFGMVRYVHEDIEFGEERVPKGTTVVCSMSSANRDERAFEGADTMNLSRSPNPHLTFGAGPHSCLGQPLARTEMQTVLEVLLRRLPGLELAVERSELRQVEGLLTGPLRELPVRW
ncbi:cytochrome P450 [Streptomyces endophyticus]|uniref:Cytochrome P450 n=1 Tax=Streptomyces endophyticus TaxID=714166 RepID=A0ABU6FB28_9ACTN|nr:cytochrome P450 [Streptomyces endophyticus]MEB8340817.1 cytochrome P450 [Streptomyces endophyticus]